MGTDEGCNLDYSRFLITSANLVAADKKELPLAADPCGLEQAS